MSKLHKVSDSQRSRRLASCRSSIPVRYVVFSEGTLFWARLLVLHGNMSVDRTNVPICFIVIIIIIIILLVFLEG